jgi:2-keto-4-pentenoate hydratase/2-oxohepta-3-ene-1,7-dioic acid hydratase in catechol pathway
MRLLNSGGRLKIVAATGLVDVEEASGGEFSHDPQAVYQRWEAFREWAERLGAGSGEVTDLSNLDAPAPRPAQVFAIGLNYVDHAGESGFDVPDEPMVFTKFLSSFTGPSGEIVLPPGNVDWEVEMVVVMGRTARNIAEQDAWSYVAGLTVGQDLSERAAQMRGPAPRFSLAKSHPGFTPMGAIMVTVDEFEDPDDLAVECRINGETVQSARTSDMIFSVPELLVYLSRIVTLLPGDLIFTGTPPSVGMGRVPQRYLQHGDVLETCVEGVGQMVHHLVLDPSSLSDDDQMKASLIAT